MHLSNGLFLLLLRSGVEQFEALYASGVWLYPVKRCAIATESKYFVVDGADSIASNET